MIRHAGHNVVVKNQRQCFGAEPLQSQQVSTAASFQLCVSASSFILCSQQFNSDQSELKAPKRFGTATKDTFVNTCPTGEALGNHPDRISANSTAHPCERVKERQRHRQKGLSLSLHLSVLSRFLHLPSYSLNVPSEVLRKRQI